MTATPSIELPAWMAEQLSQASPDLLRQMVQIFAEALMSADADAVCGAGYGQRSPDRRNTRNGYRLGAGTPAPAASSWRSRSCGRAATSRTGCWSGAGGPSRPSSAWSRPPICSACQHPQDGEAGRDRSASPGCRSRRSVEMAKDLDSQVEAFRTRPLDAGPYTFVAADALVLKVREAGRTVNVHALLATGVNADGYREILGLHVTSAEDGAGWLGFFRDLTARGLTGVALVTCDAHRGLVEAIGATLPGAAWQRCRTHYAANLMSATPKNAWGWVKALLHSVYDQPDAAAVHAQFDRILDALADKLPAVAEHLDAARADILAFTSLPQSHLAPDLVQQPPGTTEPRDPPPHRRRRHLPRPHRPGPPGRRRARRATRRMDRACAATSASTSSPKAASPRSPTRTPSDPEVTITAITA